MEYLKNLGYKNANNTYPYSYSNIKSSIDAGCPVPIMGESAPRQIGHAFIVDGYMKAECYATDRQNNMTQLDTDFVHCNVGWGDNYDGWYFQGVFYMTNGYPVATDKEIEDAIDGRSVAARSTYEVIDGYYQYNLRQVNHLKP